jgi:lysophospholipase L1-like esterase
VYLPIAWNGFDTFADNFDTPGALGPRWTGSTWTVGQNAVSNTPALGPDIVTNGDMELNGSWSSTGSPTANERSNERAHGGAYSRKIVGNSGSGAVQHDIGAADNWYLAQLHLYAAAGGGRLTLGGLASGAVTAASWTLREVAGRLAAAAGFQFSASSDGSTFYADDASVRRLITSSLIASVSEVVPDNVIVSVLPGAYAGTNLPCGIVASLDSAVSPANFLLAYTDGSSGLVLEKVVAGAYTGLISAAAAAPGAYKRLAVYRRGSNISLWCGGTQIGATQSVEDVPAAPCHGIFSTHAGNHLAELAITRGPMKTIAFLGDSIACGIPLPDISAAYSWRLANSVRYGMMNMKQHAVSGQSIFGYMDEQTAAAAGDNADIIIIALGANDGDNAGITAVYQANLIEIGGTNPNARIYCMGILPGIFGSRDANNPRILQAVTNAAVAGVNCTYWDTDGWIDPAVDCSDYVHPTAAGHAKILTQVLARLE